MGAIMNVLQHRVQSTAGIETIVHCISSRVRCDPSETPLLCPFLNTLAGISTGQSVGEVMLLPQRILF